MSEESNSVNDFTQTLRDFSKAISDFTQKVNEIDQKLNKDCWIRPSQIPSVLGEGFSERLIRELIRSGKLTYGVEYLNVSEGSKPSYLVNPLGLERYFTVPPEYRG